MGGNETWLQIMWGVLAAAWGIATFIRWVLVYLSWPTQRKRRIFAALVHAMFCLFFLWRMTQSPPDEVTPADLARNLVNFIFVVWAILEGIWATYGMAERRARLIQAGREGQ